MVRYYIYAVRHLIEERQLTPADPLAWRRAAEDEDLPIPYLPRWRSMSDEELLSLNESLSRLRDQ